MAGLTFCLNRRQGTISTAVIFGEELRPGFRVQIREQRVYGQIWEGVVDGSQVCGEGDSLGAFVGLRAILNVAAPCPGEDGYRDDSYLRDDDPPVGTGDPIPTPVIDDPPPPIEPPFVDPPMMGCLPKSSYNGSPRVEVMIADYDGHPVSCNECDVMLFP